ncbi:uncharacterized protein LOC114729035 [Neltuma alba]|uniref:uncharacterized protein LOC114729035 n=1 Tax=Neltuma alba TaxID=207710 RepID=UPI0010A382FA|nr:uncharacterized protein LOC114729035 [Prosopis alba]
MSPSADGSSVADGFCSCCLDANSDSQSDDSRSLYVNCKHCGKSGSSPSSSGSSDFFSLLSLKEWEKLRRILIASAKGFTVGAGLKGGLSLFSILARLKQRRPLTSLRKEALKTNSEAIVTAVKESMSYGLFVGTFAGTFVSMDELIGALGGHRRTARWRALLAGGIAGPSILLTGFKTHHKSLAIYILMRAAVLASRCGIKSKRFGRICKPLTWKHGDIFLMCLSSSQILSSYILKQESLPSSYKSFLNKHGGKDLVILKGVKDIASGMPFTDLEAIQRYYKAKGVDVHLDPNMEVPCSIIHENQSCGGHFLSFLLEAYKRALSVYLPVYLLPALLVHRQGLVKRPYTILAKGLVGTARSSLFLSAYCSSAWMWTCLLFRILRRCNIPMVVMGTFPTGLALGIEKKSRRMEISLYCFARAIESFFACLDDGGYLPQSIKIRRADILVFSLSTAIIMHCYAQEREVFRSKYLNVLDWVFGVPPPPCETPRCKGG